MKRLLLALCILAAPAAHADEINKKTVDDFLKNLDGSMAQAVPPAPTMTPEEIAAAQRQDDIDNFRYQLQLVQEQKRDRELCRDYAESTSTTVEDCLKKLEF